MNIEKDIIVEGAYEKPILIDAFLPEDKAAASVIIFAHGFKGFKDWGHWDLVAEAFANAGFIFIKFNFSHNGTTPEQPLNFADLEAFGNNNYTKELTDLEVVVNWVHQQGWSATKKADLQRIGLIGHSRGGGIGIIKAANDPRIKALATWAAVSRLDYSWRGKEELSNSWRNAGVQYSLNGRTKQNMPLYYQLFEDFMVNTELLDIPSALQKRPLLPMLIMHGSDDPAVPFTAAKELHHWHPNSILYKITDANHVFGGSHPFTASKLPPHSHQLVKESVAFFKEALR